MLRRQDEDHREVRRRIFAAVSGAVVRQLMILPRADLSVTLARHGVGAIGTVWPRPKYLRSTHTARLRKASSAARTHIPNASFIATSDALTSRTPRRAPRDKPSKPLKSP